MSVKKCPRCGTIMFQYERVERGAVYIISVCDNCQYREKTRLGEGGKQ